MQCVGAPEHPERGPFIPAVPRNSRVSLWFITNTQMLGIRSLFPERTQEILCVFGFSSVTLLQRIFSNIFYYQGFPLRFGPRRNWWKSGSLATLVHFLLGGKNGCRPITFAREGTVIGRLPWALASGGLQGLSSLLTQHGPGRPAPVPAPDEPGAPPSWCGHCP